MKDVGDVPLPWQLVVARGVRKGLVVGLVWAVRLPGVTYGQPWAAIWSGQTSN